MSMFDDIKQKATELVDQHGEQIADGIDKAGDFVDEKTGAQYSGHVDTAQGALRDGLDGLDGQDDDIH